jgi:hypothetical protein
LRYRVTDGKRADHLLRLLATSKLWAILLPLDLTANSSSNNIRGQLIAAVAEADGKASLLPALPARLRSRIPPDLARDLSKCIIRRSAFVSAQDDMSGLIVRLILELATNPVIKLINWLESHPEAGRHPEIIAELNEAVYGEDGIAGSDVHISESHYIDCAQIIDRDKIPALTRNWLGHNGITVSTRIIQEEFSPFQRGTLTLLSHNDFAILGSVCLFDELRPEVSVSRDSLRGLSFAIRSATQLAVRRAAAVHLASPERDSAEKIMQLDLMSKMSLKDVTTGQIESDLLMPAWRAEKIISLKSGKVNVAEARSLASKGPIEFNLNLNEGSKFYVKLQAAIAELELDIVLSDTQESLFFPDGLVILSDKRPERSPGFSVFPPLTVLNYTSPGIVMRPGSPANLLNPIIAWFAKMASILNSDYPAFFTQFQHTLTMVRFAYPTFFITVQTLQREQPSC